MFYYYQIIIPIAITNIPSTLDILVPQLRLYTHLSQTPAMIFLRPIMHSSPTVDTPNTHTIGPNSDIETRTVIES